VKFAISIERTRGKFLTAYSGVAATRLYADDADFGDTNCTNFHGLNEWR
jgi:hypothetical protein